MAKKTVSKKPAQAESRSVKAKAVSQADSPSTDFATLAGWIFLGLSALIFIQARIQLLAIPMERDEGGFAYIGHWMFHGRDLYTDMLDSKLPGLYLYYAFFTSLFGLNATGVHIGLLLANIISALCFYQLVRKMYDALVAALATSIFLFLILSPNVVGFASHATQLLSPFLLGGLLLFWKAIRSNKTYLFFVSGLLMGIAFTIKQQAVIFGILLAVLWWPARLRWYPVAGRKIPIVEWIVLGIGGLLPVLCVVGYFAAAGRFDDFYNWTVTQPFSLAGSYRLSRFEMFKNILPQVMDHYESIWILAAAGIPLIFLSGYTRERPWFGLSMGILGILSVAIGAAYYMHYFVLAMPGIAILAACTLAWISRKLGTYGAAAGMGIAAILLLIAVRANSGYYFNPDYAKIHYDTYNRNMFPEMEKIGKELGKRVPEGEKIGILGSEPEILVAAGRESCSKFLMIYALLSDPVRSPPLQTEYVEEMKACMPEYIVFNPLSASWAPGYDKLQFYLDFMPWVEEHYTAVGMAESFDDRPGAIVWDDALRNYTASSNYQIIVLRRKDKIPPSTEPHILPAAPAREAPVEVQPMVN